MLAFLLFLVASFAQESQDSEAAVGADVYGECSSYDSDWQLCVAHKDKCAWDMGRGFEPGPGMCKVKRKDLGCSKIGRDWKTCDALPHCEYNSVWDICEDKNMGSWQKILQYGSSAYTPTTGASGNLNADVSSGFAKLSDSAINAISTGDGYNYYWLTTSASNSNNGIFVRTTSSYCDTCRAMGWSNNYQLCNSDSIELCSWSATVNSASFDTEQAFGNDCNRWFADFSSTTQCYPTGSTSQRCFADGALCGHQFRGNVIIYKLGAPLAAVAVAESASSTSNLNTVVQAFAVFGFGVVVYGAVKHYTKA